MVVHEIRVIGEFGAGKQGAFLQRIEAFAQSPMGAALLRRAGVTPAAAAAVMVAGAVTAEAMAAAVAAAVEAAAEAIEGLRSF